MSKLPAHVLSFAFCLEMELAEQERQLAHRLCQPQLMTFCSFCFRKQLSKAAHTCQRSGELDTFDAAGFARIMVVPQKDPNHNIVDSTAYSHLHQHLM